MIQGRAHFTLSPCCAAWNTRNYIDNGVQTVTKLVAPLCFSDRFSEIKKGHPFYRGFENRSVVLLCTFLMHGAYRGIVFSRSCYKARAPPSDLILTYPKQNQIGEITLKEINLRKYYPYYPQDKIVSVPDEVAELLRDLAKEEDARRIRTYRHKALYSLELMSEIREIPSDEPLPKEILEERNMKELLYKGLESLPEKQRSRLVAYFFVGMTQAEIVAAEGAILLPYAMG